MQIIKFFFALCALSLKNYYTAYRVLEPCFAVRSSLFAMTLFYFIFPCQTPAAQGLPLAPAARSHWWPCRGWRSSYSLFSSIYGPASSQWTGWSRCFSISSSHAIPWKKKCLQATSPLTMMPFLVAQGCYR